MLLRRRFLLTIALIPFIAGCFGKSISESISGAKEIEPKQSIALEGGAIISKHGFAISSDGSRAVVLHKPGVDSIIQIWDLSQPKKSHEIKLEKQNVISVSITPDGQWGLYRLWDVGCHLLDLAHDYQVTKFGTTEFSQVRFTPDSKKLVGCNDSNISVWDLNTKKQLLLWSTPIKGRKYVYSSLFGNGTRIAAGDERGEVAIWDITTGKVVHSWKSQPAHAIQGIAVSPDGKLLAMARETQGHQVWDIDSQTLQYTGIAKPTKAELCEFADANTLAYVDITYHEKKFTSTLFLEKIGSNARTQSKPISGSIFSIHALHEQQTLVTDELSDKRESRMVKFWNVAP